MRRNAWNRPVARHLPLELVRDVRLKVDVGALGAIKELEISNEWRRREDVFQIPDLTPTIVPHHDIGDETGVAQRQRGTRHLLRVEYTGLRIPYVVMCMRGWRTLRFVDNFLNAGRALIMAAASVDATETLTSLSYRCGLGG
jgi:hypothetical protein